MITTPAAKVPFWAAQLLIKRHSGQFHIPAGKFAVEHVPLIDDLIELVN